MERATGTVTSDPVAISPHIYKVLLDNDRVRLLDVVLKPGEISPEHTHGPMIIYTITDGQVVFTYPDGSSDEVELPAGYTVWVDGVTHTVENIGDTELHALNIELKK